MSDTQPRPEGAPESGSILKRVGPMTSLLAIGALALPPLSGFALIAFMPQVSAFFRSHDQAGPVYYAIAFAVLAGLALLPTYAQSALGGFAFGMWVGLAGALAGFAGGALIGYAVARRASGDRVTRLLHERPKWEAVRDALVRDHESRSFWKTAGMVALLRMPPNSPFALTNLVMASVKVPVGPFVVGTVVGMLPRTAAAVWIGHTFGLSKDGGFDTPLWLRVVGGVAAVLVLAVVMFIADRAVKKITGAAAKTPKAAAGSTGQKAAG